MSRILFFLVSIILSVGSLAQDAEKDKEEKARVRVDGAAGGTGQQLSKEQREAVKTGEGQHRTHKEALGRVKKDDQQGPKHDEASSDRQKARGAQ